MSKRNPDYREDNVMEPKFKQVPINDNSISTPERNYIKSQNWMIEEGLHPKRVENDKYDYLKTKDEKSKLITLKNQFKYQTSLSNDLRKQMVNTIAEVRKLNFNSLKPVIYGSPVKQKNNLI